ncbi:MAG: hypothetical protein EAZ62_00035 [Sphingobacteriia bacterium]|nr:MAG: hypothetical protein EAZ62_00035 [Sphingobacteriia bacterium]
MNWGTRIIIGYAAGVIFISYFVVRSMMLTTEMAEENYYEKELAYNGRLQATANGKSAISAFAYDPGTQTVRFQVDSSLSTQWDSASLHFYYAAAKSKDKTVPLLASSSGQYQVSTQGMGKGQYVLKLSFVSQQNNYFKEQSLFIP